MKTIRNTEEAEYLIFCIIQDISDANIISDRDIATIELIMMRNLDLEY